MNKLIFLIILFFIVGCNANETLVNTLKPNFESMSFDVVQKQLVIKQDLPDHVEILVTNWFNEKVKINGFDGDMTFIIYDYSQEISPISDGKKIDTSLFFQVLLNKPTLSQKKLIEGSVSSYGTLTGVFSLSEIDTVIQNTQSDLILRLSRDLQSKI